MNVRTHGLTLRPRAQVSSEELLYEFGYWQDGIFRVAYVGQTGRAASRFGPHHDGQRRAYAAGAFTHLAAHVDGEENRRAIETILVYELQPPCNRQPMPTYEEYEQAKQVWRSYRTRQEIVHALLTAPPKTGNAFARRKTMNALLEPPPSPLALPKREDNAFAAARRLNDINPLLTGLMAPRKY